MDSDDIGVDDWIALLDHVAKIRAYQMLAEVAINYDTYGFPKCLDIHGPCNHPNCPLYDTHYKAPRWCLFEEYAKKYKLDWTYDEEGNACPC